MATEITGQADPRRSTIRVRLEQDMRFFAPVLPQFLQDFAELVGVDNDDLWVTRMSKGCVILYLSIENSEKKRIKAQWPEIKATRGYAQFAKKYDLTWVRFYEPAESKISIIKRVLDSGRTLTWLHFSDVHVRSEGGGKVFSQQRVLEELVASVPGLLKEWALVPDLLFFTGDVAFSGQEEEYAKANSVLSSLYETLPKRAQLLCVPGNHDVHWGSIDAETERALRNRLVGEDEVNSLWLDRDRAPERAAVLARLSAYRKFSMGLKGKGQPAIDETCTFAVQIEKHGVKVGIAGLNSAWLSTKKNLMQNREDKVSLDLGSLALGEPQLHSGLQRIDGADVKICLLHHPPFSNWFRDFDAAIQEQVLQEFDFVLRGHVHREAFTGVRSLSKESELIHLASAAMYLHQRHPNGFSAVKLDLKTGVMTVFSWSYLERSRVWQKNLGLGPEGFTQILLPKRVLRSLGIRGDRAA